MSRKSNAAQNDAAGLDPTSPDRQYTIGELAEAFGLTTRAIRFYESKGLISPPRKGVARAYSRRERARLSLIQRGKNLGFSLDEIGEWLSLYDGDPSQVTQSQVLLGRVDKALFDLTKKRADIDRALKDLKDIRIACIDILKGAGKL